MISITRDDFDVGAAIDRLRRPDMGALVTFLGVVRDDGIEEMDLEAYEEVAVREFAAIRDEAFANYPIKAVEIIHRIGRLRVGDNILLIVVGAGHRKEAFSACEHPRADQAERADLEERVREGRQRKLGAGEYPGGDA